MGSGGKILNGDGIGREAASIVGFTEEEGKTRPTPASARGPARPLLGTAAAPTRGEAVT